MPSIKELLRRYVLVELYADRLPAGSRSPTTAEENRQLRDEAFHDARLPLYVILRPTADGKYQEISRFDEGKIISVDAFARFLREPLNANGGDSVAQAREK